MLVSRPVASCGLLWLPVASCGFLWLPVASSGFLWLSVASCRFLWLPVASCGFLWLCSCRFLWLSGASCGFLWLPLASCGFLWLPGPFGVSWGFPDFQSIYVKPSNTRNGSLPLSDFIWRYLAPSGAIWRFHIGLGFT
jgi:hypothetical protein